MYYIDLETTYHPDDVIPTSNNVIIEKTPSKENQTPVSIRLSSTRICDMLVWLTDNSLVEDMVDTYTWLSKIKRLSLIDYNYTLNNGYTSLSCGIDYGEVQAYNDDCALRQAQEEIASAVQGINRALSENEETVGTVFEADLSQVTVKRIRR